MKKSFLSSLAVSLFLLCLFVVPSIVFAADGPKGLCVDEKCGETELVKDKGFEHRFLEYSDENGRRYGYYFDALDKREKGQGWKIKPMLVKESLDGKVYRYHLKGCVRNQPTKRAGLKALANKGFCLVPTGSELDQNGNYPEGLFNSHYGKIYGPLPDSVYEGAGCKKCYE